MKPSSASAPGRDGGVRAWRGPWGARGPDHLPRPRFPRWATNGLAVRTSAESPDGPRMAHPAPRTHRALDTPRPPCFTPTRTTLPSVVHPRSREARPAPPPPSRAGLPGHPRSSAPHMTHLAARSQEERTRLREASIHFALQLDHHGEIAQLLANAEAIFKFLTEEETAGMVGVQE